MPKNDTNPDMNDNATEPQAINPTALFDNFLLLKPRIRKPSNGKSGINIIQSCISMLPFHHVYFIYIDIFFIAKYRNDYRQSHGDLRRGDRHD